MAVSAAVSPLLLTFARGLYVSVGGTARLGLGGGTVARLFLGRVSVSDADRLVGSRPAADWAAG